MDATSYIQFRWSYFFPIHWLRVFPVDDTFSPCIGSDYFQLIIHYPHTFHSWRSLHRYKLSSNDDTLCSYISASACRSYPSNGSAIWDWWYFSTYTSLPPTHLLHLSYCFQAQIQLPEMEYWCWRGKFRGTRWQSPLRGSSAYGMLWPGTVYTMVWHGMVGMVGRDMVWHGKTWYSRAWEVMKWHDRGSMVWTGIIWYDMAWHYRA